MKCPARSFLAVAVVAAGWMASPAVSASDNPYKLKAGARGGLCLECHVAFEETLKRSHVHTPVREGDCSDCHDPHASSHGALLAAGSRGTCLRCHDDLVPAEATSAHSSVIEGNCAVCHDPHASDHAEVLLESGNRLCAQCHADVSRTVEAAEFGHAPVEDDCLSCHDPHASAKADSLLTRDEPELCVQCHDPSVGAFRARHSEYPVDEGRCTSCHDPHGSDQGGLLWANVHAPVVNRMCAQCHADADTAEPLSLARTGTDLCRGCHADVTNRIAAAEHVHWPVLDRKACLHCHDPHASPVSGLLSGPTRPLCGSCHADTLARLERAVAKHAPAAEGQCGACHEPHASDHAFLFPAGSQTEVCGNCHDWERHTMHPIGPKVVDSRNPNLTVDCGSCHRGHGTGHEHMTVFDSKRALCVECHEAFRR